MPKATSSLRQRKIWFGFSSSVASYPPFCTPKACKTGGGAQGNTLPLFVRTRNGYYAAFDGLCAKSRFPSSPTTPALRATPPVSGGENGHSQGFPPWNRRGGAKRRGGR